MKTIEEIEKMNKGTEQAKCIREYADFVFEKYKKAIKEGRTEEYNELQDALYYAYLLANDGTGRDKNGRYPTEYTGTYHRLYKYIESLYHSKEIRCEQIDTLIGFYDIGQMLQTAFEQDDITINQANEKLKNIELDGKLYSISFQKGTDNSKDTITLVISCSDGRKVTAKLTHDYYSWCYSSRPADYQTNLDIEYNTTMPDDVLGGNKQLYVYTMSHNNKRYTEACSTISDMNTPQIKSDSETASSIPFRFFETDWTSVHHFKNKIIGKNELQFLNQKLKSFISGITSQDSERRISAYQKANGTKKN